MEKRLHKVTCGLTNNKDRREVYPAVSSLFYLTKYTYFGIIKKIKKKVKILMKPYFYVFTNSPIVPKLCFTSNKRAELVEVLLSILAKTSLQFVQNDVDDFEIPLSEHSKIKLGSDNKLSLVGVVGFETHIDTDTILKLNKVGLTKHWKN